MCGQVAKDAIRLHMLASRLEHEKQMHEQTIQSYTLQMSEKDDLFMEMSDRCQRLREVLNEKQKEVDRLREQQMAVQADNMAWLQGLQVLCSGFARDVGEIREWVTKPKTVSKVICLSHFCRCPRCP